MSKATDLGRDLIILLDDSCIVNKQLLPSVTKVLKELILEEANSKLNDFECIIEDFYRNVISNNCIGLCANSLSLAFFESLSLQETLEEMIYHAGLFCSNLNKSVILITTRWDRRILSIYSRILNEFHGININFVILLVTDSEVTKVPASLQLLAADVLD